MISKSNDECEMWPTNLHECFRIITCPLLEVASGLEATKSGIARNSRNPDGYISQAMN
jgi:hypothetical protein